MKQKDIYWADLEPIIGQEQGGVRPVVIISGNTMNKNFGISIACPLSSQIKNYKSCVIVKKNSINKLKTDSEIITFQIRTVSQKRLKNKIGQISHEELKQVLIGLQKIFTY